MTNLPLPPSTTAGLLEVMARLRTPDTGCPWDLEQDFSTIAPYTIEEAYEVAEAIERNDMAALKDELGDLLFQAVFHARMAEEAGEFTFQDVVAGVVDKMIRRHPHVFADASVETAEAQTKAWESHKALERAEKANRSGAQRAGLLDGVSLALPGLTRAVKLQNRAARGGFDWPDVAPVLDKLDEETAELKSALADTSAGPEHRRRRVAEEMGDLLFVCANLARRLEIDPEAAIRAANAKFERRFRHVEDRLAQSGREPHDSTLEEMDSYWNEAKALES